MSSRRRCAVRVVVLAVGGFAFALGCGGGDGGSTGPSGLPVEGTWTFFESLASADRSVQCEDQGRLDFIRSGSLLDAEGSQQGVCVAPGGPVDNSGADSLKQLQVGDSTISFSFGGCSYRGDLIGSPPDSLAGTVACLNRGPSLTGTWFAARGLDLNPPTVSAVQVGPEGDTLFVPKDTFRLTVSAEDDRMLLYVGYRLGAPASVQDSARVVAKSGEATFELPTAIPVTWVGDTPLTLFARDALGRTIEQSGGVLRVHDLIRQPLRIVKLGAMATDMEYDPKRDLIYLLEQQAGQVASLRLSDFTFGTPITFPTDDPASTWRGIDLSPGGDSLLAAISTPATLHVVNLVSGTSSDVAITDAGSDSHSLADVHVAAGRAFVYGERSVAGFINGRIWELNLATQVLEPRVDVGAGGNGNLGLSTEFATSGDGSSLLLVDTPARCLQVFSAATGFSPCAEPPGALSFFPSGSNDGSSWLVRHLLYDANLTVTATPVAEGTPAGVLAPDGSRAYFPTPLGIQVVDIPSGSLREHIRVPIAVARLTLLPEANRIAVWNDGVFGGDGNALTQVVIVDLP
jgi:hypothetical protein